MFTIKKLCFFNVGFETHWYIHSMFPRKKLCFFFNPISIYTLCSQEKNYVFSIWDKKNFFGLNTST
jgi:DUF1365 family protein